MDFRDLCRFTRHPVNCIHSCFVSFWVGFGLGVLAVVSCSRVCHFVLPMGYCGGVVLVRGSGFSDAGFLGWFCVSLVFVGLLYYSLYGIV